MKKIIYICIAALAVALTGCSSEKDIDMDLFGGKGLEFVHFASASDTWLVTSEDASYDYDIVVAHTYAYDNAVTYNVAVGENTTGVEGIDFSLAAKSVTIDKGSYSGKLPVKVLYDTTGEGFVLELILSVEEGLINPVYGAKCLLTVKSDKITMDWDWLSGSWTCQDYNYHNGKNEGDPYTVAIAKVDETHGTLTGIWGGGPLNFTVDFDAKTLTIVGNQFNQHVAKYSADLYFVAVDPKTGYDVYDPITTPVMATFSPAGIVIDNYDFLLVGGQYDGYTYAGGKKSTLTK